MRVRSKIVPAVTDTRAPQPAHMKDYVRTQSDNGGVHINSGIPNKAFYELAIALGRDVTVSRAPRRKDFEPTLIVRQSTAPPHGVAIKAAPTGIGGSAAAPVA